MDTYTASMTSEDPQGKALAMALDLLLQQAEIAVQGTSVALLAQLAAERQAEAIETLALTAHLLLPSSPKT
jgi:hypothetical protein